MFNSTGTTKAEFGNRKQILANVEHQVSIGCVVGPTLGVTVGNQRIAKAGTPVYVDLMNTQTPAVLATSVIAGNPPEETGAAMNGVLLHDVDMTGKNANNGTVLLFGFVNVNRIDTDVQALVNTALGNADATKLVTFVKL